MSTHPWISIVVPFFDSREHIAACIESLLEQETDGDPPEIIFIDNGSSDGSPAIVAEFDGLTVLQESTPGAYAARNTGIRRARAPVIALTDADCVADPTWLREIRLGLQDPAVDVLLGHSRYPSNASFTLRLLGAYENAKTEYVLDHCAPAHRFAYANNMAVRTSVFSEIGPFKEWRRAADSELIHRLTDHRPDARVAYRDSMRVTHREFVRARDRARRLSLYTHTNSKIDTFRELGPRQRAGILFHLLRRQLSTG